MEKHIYGCRKCGFEGDLQEFRGPDSLAPLSGRSYPIFRCPICSNSKVKQLVFIKAVDAEEAAKKNRKRD